MPDQIGAPSDSTDQPDQLTYEPLSPEQVAALHPAILQRLHAAKTTLSQMVEGQTKLAPEVMKAVGVTELADLETRMPKLYGLLHQAYSESFGANGLALNIPDVDSLLEEIPSEEDGEEEPDPVAIDEVPPAATEALKAAEIILGKMVETRERMLNVLLKKKKVKKPFQLLQNPGTAMLHSLVEESYLGALSATNTAMKLPPVPRVVHLLTQSKLSEKIADCKLRPEDKWNPLGHSLLFSKTAIQAFEGSIKRFSDAEPPQPIPTKLSKQASAARLQAGRVCGRLANLIDPEKIHPLKRRKKLEEKARFEEAQYKHYQVATSHTGNPVAMKNLGAIELRDAKRSKDAEEKEAALDHLREAAMWLTQALTAKNGDYPAASGALAQVMGLAVEMGVVDQIYGER